MAHPQFWQPRAWRDGSLVRRGMALTFVEGGVVGAMVATYEMWMVPMLQQRLAAAAFVLGLLAIIPQLGIIGLSPWSGAVIRRLGGNKRTSVLTVKTQIVLTGLLSIPLWAAPGSAWAIVLATAIISLFGLTGAIGGPAWVSWMGALIPRPVAGRFLANRLVAYNGVKLAAAAAMAGIMQFLPATEGAWGLQIVIAIAFVSRCVSLWFICRTPEPPPRREVRSQPASLRSSEAAVGLLGFIRTAPHTDLGRWTIVWGSFMAGAMVAGPFYASYLLEPAEQGGMALGPWPYTAVLYTGAIARMIFFPAVGRMVDRLGPAAVMRMAMVALLAVPVAWFLVPADRWWLLVVNEAFAGVAWAMIECAITAMLCSCHRDPARRAELIGYHGTVMAILMGAGALVGTILVKWVPPIGGSVFHAIVLISMLLRVPGFLLAMRWLPSKRPFQPEDLDDLWMSLPGAAQVGAFGRSLIDSLRRPFG